MEAQRHKAETFKALHKREGVFVIPNPWDAGSARMLAALGFEALATTSSGLAHAKGRMDGEITLEEKLEHCRELSRATDVPVSADLEKGFADSPEGVANTIIRFAETGIVGASIEDYTGDALEPIYPFDLAVERIHAAVEAARSLDFPFTLTARADNLWHGRNDLDDTIRRLQAFEAAGADVLYAPGLSDMEQLRLVASAVSKPLNVLGASLPGVTVAELGGAGAKRISVGGALARATWTTLMHVGAQMKEQGSLDWLREVMPPSELTRVLAISGPTRPATRRRAN